MSGGGENMNEIYLSGLFAQPIAQRVRDWVAAGKVSEDDLDRELTTEARAHVEHSIGLDDWASLEDIEGLIELASQQLGGDTGLVEWADEIVEAWCEEERLERVLHAGRSLMDTPGFIVSQASEILIRDADWFYEGGRSVFSVRFAGIGDASSKLKSLLGASLARLAAAAGDHDFDVRFEGVDSDDLVVFGEAPVRDEAEGGSRLHQAALSA